MSYTKLCSKCGFTIIMIEINGKWHAFEDPTATTLHRCSDVRSSNSIVEKIWTLEKIVRQLNDKIISQQEKIDELSRRRI